MTEKKKLVDIMVQSKIQDARRDVETTKQRVREVIRRLQELSCA